MLSSASARTAAAVVPGAATPPPGSPPFPPPSTGGAAFPSAPVGAPVASPPGAAGALLAAVQAEVGQAEAPAGSNDSPRIAQYREAVAGAPGPGPWCAYFASWAARGAGAALGERGEGFASVDALYAWAERSGRANPASSGQPPSPGDLIIWDEHMGIVEAVLPDGSVQTIEGNSSDQVARRVHPPGAGAGAGGPLVGYVRTS